MAQSRAKKKVLIAITKSNFGGAQRYVYEIARLLKPLEYEVVVAHGGSGILAEKLKSVGVRTVQIPGLDRDVRLGADFRALISLIQIIRSERPDVLHLNSSKIGLMGTAVGRLLGVPNIIFTAHGWPFNENRSQLEKRALRFLARITVLLSHHTVAVSNALAHTIDPQRKIEKLVVIHNGVEQGALIDKDEARRLLLPVHDSGEYWFGTIAELHSVKGLTYAIESFREHVTTHPNSRYIIIGEGDEHARLQEQIRRAGLERTVFLSGFLDNAARYLSAFDTFVLPSLSEGLSYAILEAGSTGIPVIATRVGGIPEIIEDGISGLLCPSRDSIALAHAFEQMTNSPEYRTKLGQSLKTRVETHFSLPQMFEKTVALY
jgi:glycosyltransferase involved in cell wall biosynthesis